MKERFAALQELSGHRPGAHISIDALDQWYVSVEGVEIKDTPSTAKGLLGRGTTPEAAVADAWKNATTRLTSEQYLIVDGLRDTRAAYRWNGSRWARVQEPG